MRKILDEDGAMLFSWAWNELSLHERVKIISSFFEWGAETIGEQGEELALYAAVDNLARACWQISSLANNPNDDNGDVIIISDNYAKEHLDYALNDRFTPVRDYSKRTNVKRCQRRFHV